MTDHLEEEETCRKFYWKEPPAPCPVFSQLEEVLHL